LGSCDRRLKAEFCGFVKERLTTNLRVVVSVKKWWMTVAELVVRRGRRCFDWLLIFYLVVFDERQQSEIQN